ncbi:DUF4407 domain-containing protein [Nocardia alni]|uniref:DUF4407 domain-containing protein n=1 Tax=Nocardia alni TaxID=2815723 RepID=UPI001C2479E5|nr:DUF4407 domain-containing protein [Nocardia alni]
MTAPHFPSNPLTWLGGAGSGIIDRHERAAYATTGAVVLVFAAICGAVVAAAAVQGHWPWFAVVLALIIALALAGALARTLATAPLPSGRRPRFGDAPIARIAMAGLAGVVVAELATTVLLGGAVDRRLDDSARLDAESATPVVAARTTLDQARADRGALDHAIAQARSDIGQALIVARCEYHPGPQCPQNEITGVPGVGPETRTDNSMLDDARTRLAAAQARVQSLEDRVTRDQQALDSARATAVRTGDRGPGARWLAMNDYSWTHPGALLLRLASIVIVVALALLPLLLRRWRGETAFDRGMSTRAAADRAENAADTAIAIKRAEVRAESEILRADGDLAAAHLAAHADTVIDRERQRHRIVASIGAVQIGVSAPQRRAIAEFEALAELPADPATRSQEEYVNPPASQPSTALTPASSRALEPAPRTEQPGGLELPLIGTVPFTDTAARWIRPLVPSFVTDAIDTATHPLRTVRHVLEETEEITFTLRRTRKITIDTTAPGGPDRSAHAVIDAEKFDAPGHSALGRGTDAPAYDLPATGERGALADRSGSPELKHRGTRQLPPGNE